MHGEDLGSRAVTPDPTGEDAAQHSIPAELNGASAGDDVVGRIITHAIRHPAPFGQLGCNAPTNIETKVKTSSAERVRRHRARKKIAAELEELTFVRRDWALFLDPYRLPQKAGCRADQMRALALKELVDNGLDHAANVTLDQIDNDTWSVADDGPGMDRVRIATLFAVDRPLTSTKLLRRPTRGAVGNGLRVVTGAAMASGGSLHVESRGRRFEIKVHLGTGRTEAVETECNAPTGVGTRVTIRFGAALARSPYDGSLASQALRFPGRACEPMRSHLGWYDARSWLELVQAAPAGTPVAQLLAHMGIESTDQRAALDVAFVELAKLELPPEPKLLTRGAGGLEGADYAKAGAAGVLVEAWAMAPARVPRSQGSATLAVYVNRTPVLADARISSTDGMHIHGGGFYCRLEKVPAARKAPLQPLRSAAVTPSWRDSNSRSSPRNSRSTASCLRRADIRRRPSGVDPPPPAWWARSDGPRPPQRPRPSSTSLQSSTCKAVSRRTVGRGTCVMRHGLPSLSGRPSSPQKIRFDRRAPACFVTRVIRISALTLRPRSGAQAIPRAGCVWSATHPRRAIAETG